MQLGDLVIYKGAGTYLGFGSVGYIVDIVHNKNTHWRIFVIKLLSNGKQSAALECHIEQL